MKFFYSAGVKGYGLKNRWWHKWYNFPTLPAVTKTITLNKKKGHPFAIARFGKTIWNRVALHNCGFDEWYINCYNRNFFQDIIVSIAGNDQDLNRMMCVLNLKELKGLELNFSCPNIKSHENKYVPSTPHDIYLKLNYTQDPYKYNLDRVKGIRVNSIPTKFGGLSGKAAQKKNWKFIEKFNKEGLNVAGASCLTFDDFKRMEDIGCKEIGLGVITLINPRIISKIKGVI